MAIFNAWNIGTTSYSPWTLSILPGISKNSGPDAMRKTFILVSFPVPQRSQTLNCKRTFVEPQLLGIFNKDRKRLKSILVTFESVWDNRKVISKTMDDLFLHENTLTSAEFFLNDHILANQMLATRHTINRSGIECTHLKKN